MPPQNPCAKPCNTPEKTQNNVEKSPNNLAPNNLAETLNNNCFCTTLNPEQLNEILNTDDLHQDTLTTHPQLFSNTSVFISNAQLQKIKNIIHAITRITQLPLYQQQAFAKAPQAARIDVRTSGVFMGYDFHLSEQDVKLIEINTNAGGAFLNAALMNAQKECCRAVNKILNPITLDLDSQFIDMFLNEWKLQGRSKPLLNVAIIDEKPEQQFLYPEFKMAKRLFERNGITAFIIDPSELRVIDDLLYYKDTAIDLIYNRLTDFSLSDPHQTIIRQAHEQDKVVLTPNPYHHALYADKRNLVTLSNETELHNIGASENDIFTLQSGVPQTLIVTTENANELWRNRKEWFFKPATGFGSRATYRGDKVTKRVWNEIIQGNYVAQALVKPSERGIIVDEHETTLKMDIRAYAYQGEIQLLAARLYQGQTTNFRTEGGGFAPVFTIN